MRLEECYKGDFRRVDHKQNILEINYVIYLKKDGKIAESPYIRTFLDVQQIHRFDFVNVKMWETPTEELMGLGLTGLLPLLPLTKEGGKREVIEEVVTEILQVEDKAIQKNLLTITFTLSSLALNIQDDKTWLVRRFRMFQDLIRDTEIYQYIMHEGLEQGIEKGREQGREQERQEVLQSLRQTLIAFVQARSAELVPLAQKKAEKIDSIQMLNALLLNVGNTQSAEDVRHYLEEVKDK